MNRYIIPAFVCILTALVSCAPEEQEDPFKAAVIEKIKTKVEPDADIRIFSFERIDSTTIGEELAYRQEVFNVRKARNEELRDRFLGEGKRMNAQRKAEDIAGDIKVIAGLEQIAVDCADRLSEIAYYDYKFSGKAIGKTEITDFKDYVASMSPEGEVLAIETSQKAAHKALGRTIPGYKELIESVSDSKEEE